MISNNLISVLDEVPGVLIFYHKLDSLSDYVSAALEVLLRYTLQRYRKT